MIYFTKNTYTNLKALLDDFLFSQTKTTYSDEELTIQQCKPIAHRSISDLLELSQTYLPETSLEDLLGYIYNLRKEAENPHKIKEFLYYRDVFRFPVLFLCPDINKVVLANFVGSSIRDLRPLFFNYNFRIGNLSDEMWDKVGNDGYSLKQLKEILHESLQTEN